VSARTRVDARFDADVPLVVVKVGQYPLHHGGLGAVRTMGRAGVPVYAMTEDRFTPTAMSRYLTNAIVTSASPGATDDVLLETFARVGRRIGRPAIALPTDDEAAIFLAEHRDALAPWFVTPAVDAALPRELASKRGLHAICRRYSVPAPASCFPRTSDDVGGFAKTAIYPVVAKNADPWVRLVDPAVQSNVLVASADELAEIAAQWGSTPHVALQEYIPREDAEDWIFHGYFDNRSECLVGFTGVKYRSWPPGFGVTTYARTQANDDVTRLTVDLVRALGYRGIVDLDWRYDRRDGRYKLLDFNPRVGAQFRLFETDTALDVVRAMHLDLTGRTFAAGAPVDGRTLVLEHLDVPARLAGRANDTWHSSARTPSGPRALGWFARDDPMPFFAMAARFSGPALKRVVQMGRARVRSSRAP
jgi:predicted ATP-grasp superfamily ATP-dependent carboligase